MEEIARPVARRHILRVEAATGQCLCLELVDILARRGRRQRVPVEIEPRRFENLAELITLVERARRLDLVDQGLRDRLARLVLDGVVRQHLRVERPILVELRGKLDKVACYAGPRNGWVRLRGEHAV